VSEISRSTAHQYVSDLQKPDNNGRSFSNRTILNAVFSIGSVFNIPGVLPDGMPNSFNNLQIDKSLDDESISREVLTNDAIENLFSVALEKGQVFLCVI